MKLVEALKRYLIRCCYWYYVKGEPIITDQGFDRTFSDLQGYEREQGIEDPTSPTQMIYGDCESQYTEAWMKTKDRIEPSWG